MPFQSRFLDTVPAKYRLGSQEHHVKQTADRPRPDRLHDQRNLGRVCGHAGFLKQLTARAVKLSPWCGVPPGSTQSSRPSRVRCTSSTAC
jgi:hypothetical protein